MAILLRGTKNVTYTQTDTVQTENRDHPQLALCAGRVFGVGGLGSIILGDLGDFDLDKAIPSEDDIL